MNRRNRYIFWAVAGYRGASLVWILYSDHLLSAFGDIQSMLWRSMAKGIFFVVASATGFLFMLRGQVICSADDRHMRLRRGAALTWTCDTRFPAESPG